MDLIQFIFENPLPGQSWQKDRWKAELSTKIPDWKVLLKESSRWNYGEVERVILTKNWHSSGKSRSELCETLVEAGGLEFAKRCFYSTVPHLKKAAEKWFGSNKCMWSKFDPRIKNQIISDFVDHAPGRQYLPLPKEVESFRFIMADADDIVYLKRLDEMISRRLKAYPVTSLQHPIHILDNDEKELIARLMEITRRNGYLSSTLPSIFVSSETPRIFVTHPELEEEEENWDERDKDWIPRNWRKKPETISIEELLGVYDHELQQIIIYKRGIKWLERQGFDKKWLSAVVLIHEIGHWITHQLPKPEVPTWRTDLYDSSAEDVREGWAQLITWWIADQVDGKFKWTFEELNKMQSPPYRVFKQFKEEPIDEVMASLEKLRLLQWPARLEDWKKALEE